MGVTRGHEKVDATIVSCPLIDDTKIQCPVPAGVPLDLRLRAKGFVSHFYWNQVLKPGESRTLGKLELVPGASIVGWIDAPSRDFRFSDCKVTLLPKSAADSRNQAESLQRSRMAFKTTPNERGFFEISGMSPGQYTLIIEHPTYATNRRSPVQIFPRAETEIRNLELSPPAELAINIFPPVSTTGEPWRVLLLKESDVPGHLDSKLDGHTQSGLWVGKELAPFGELVLTVPEKPSEAR